MKKYMWKRYLLIKTEAKGKEGKAGWSVQELCAEGWS